MAFSIGIVGLPNVGKSTLFQALTKIKVKTAPYPFTTIEPNFAKVPIPDQKLKILAQIIKPEKIMPAFIEFIDIAGLVKGAHQGAGLGNQFLSHLQECEALVEVVRVFEDKNVEHPEGKIDPLRDIKILEEEFLQKDLKTIEKNLLKFQKEAKKGKKEAQELVLFLEKMKESLLKKEKILNFSQKEKKWLKRFQFLTPKPILYLFNIKEGKDLDFKIEKISPFLVCDLKLEEEISQLSEKEKKDLKILPFFDKFLKACYNLLNLITFYTIKGGKEIRAHLIKKGTLVKEAAFKVHSDFGEKFIRAEVLNFTQFSKIGSWQKAKSEGKIKIVSKDYQVREGDIIEFKI